MRQKGGTNVVAEDRLFHLDIGGKHHGLNVAARSNLPHRRSIQRLHKLGTLVGARGGDGRGTGGDGRRTVSVASAP